jgi:hypothetical protein
MTSALEAHAASDVRSDGSTYARTHSTHTHNTQMREDGGLLSYDTH